MYAAHFHTILQLAVVRQEVREVDGGFKTVYLAGLRQCVCGHAYLIQPYVII